MISIKTCATCRDFLYVGKDSTCPTCVNLSNWVEDKPLKPRNLTQKEVFKSLYGPKPTLPKEDIMAISLSKSVQEELTKMAEATLDDYEPDMNQPFEESLPGKKFDKDKVDWTLMPWKELEQVLMVLEFGAKKYSRDNWKHIEPARYEKAAMRHLISYITGELNDPETGRSHLAHLICNALFLMWNDNNRDDS